MRIASLHRSCDRDGSAVEPARVGPSVARPRAVFVGSVLALTVAIAAPGFALTLAPNYQGVPAPRRGIDTLPVGWSPPRAAHTLRNLSYGPTPRNKLDLYLPDARKFPGARPVIIWLHSGGWVAGSRAYTADVIQREITRGFAVASVDYALAPTSRFPVPLQDVKVAIRWAKTYATHYHFNPAKVILAGGSAGGHVATLAAVTPGRFEPTTIPAPLSKSDDTVAAVVDLAGPTDMYAFDHETGNGATGAWARSMGAALLGCANPPAPSLLRCPAGIERAASVAPYLSPQSPPVFMAYGALDTLVPPSRQAIPLARTWASLKGKNAVWVEILGNTGHNVSVDTLNNTYFDRFLAGVLNGSIH
jgi:acetyl esterase/lipase